MTSRRVPLALTSLLAIVLSSALLPLGAGAEEEIPTALAGGDSGVAEALTSPQAVASCGAAAQLGAVAGLENVAEAASPQALFTCGQCSQSGCQGAIPGTTSCFRFGRRGTCQPHPGIPCSDGTGPSCSCLSGPIP